MTSAIEEFRKWLANPDAPSFTYFSGNLLLAIHEATGEEKARLKELAAEVWSAPVHLTRQRVGPPGADVFDYVAVRARKSPPERWNPGDITIFSPAPVRRKGGK
jgi:hypothetical protein